MRSSTVFRGGGWMEAKRKPFRNWVPTWDSFPSGSLHLGMGQENVRSFYISEFPDTTKAKDLFGLFGCIGCVVEFSIAPRRNKVGKRFGFARFKDVLDSRLLAVSLDNVIICGRKIHANEPRFERMAPVGRCFVGGKRGLGAGPGKGVERQRDSRVEGFGYRGRHGNRSYADVVVDKVQELPETSRNLLEFFSSVEVRNRLGKAFVGKVLIAGSTFGIQTKLEMEGIFAIKATPLGEWLCLLEESESGVIDSLVEEGELWWKNCFEKISKWEDCDVDSERSMWIRIYGVPIQAWNADFFVMLADSLGKFFCLDEGTVGDSCLAVARMRILVPLDFKLPDSVMVCIDGRDFRLVLREDSGFHNSTGHRSNSSVSDSNPSESEIFSVDIMAESDDEIEEFSSAQVATGSVKEGDRVKQAESAGDLNVEGRVSPGRVVSVPSRRVAAGSPTSSKLDSGSAASICSKVDANGLLSENCSVDSSSFVKESFDRTFINDDFTGSVAREVVGSGEATGNGGINSSCSRNLIDVKGDSGAFDQALSIIKDRRRCRKKRSSMRKLSVCAGSLHNRATRVANFHRGRSLFSKQRATVSHPGLGPSSPKAIKGFSLPLEPVLDLSRGDRVDSSIGGTGESIDIINNNRRQWSMLDREDGTKLWKAMEALGVMNKGKEEQTIQRIHLLENEAMSRKSGKKESKIGFP
ncbi:uncharacterized protein LOC131658029 [Vicia villosa]|uniref:uncharacterized protein LOC131658029 n=1 Tax=Vicia villosa TaxID=3911 RepID=UPI00273C0619|nr:uncharacterized protein LOC131658029 [Vicia villosa]